MKKVTNYVMALLCVGSLAFSAGAFMKVNAAPATNSCSTRSTSRFHLCSREGSACCSTYQIRTELQGNDRRCTGRSIRRILRPIRLLRQSRQRQGGTRKQRVQTPKKEGYRFGRHHQSGRIHRNQQPRGRGC